MENSFPEEEYIFVCHRYDDILDLITAGDGWAGVGAFVVAEFGKDSRLHFSRGVLHSGLQLVTLGSRVRDYWSWLYSFSWDLWGGLLATAFLLGFIIYAFEKPWKGHESDFKGKTGWINALWYSFSSITMTMSAEMKSVPARLLVWMFWFLMLILTATYTADVVSRLQAEGVELKIANTDDLDGADVGLYNIYEEEGIVKEYGGNPVYYDGLDLSQMIDDLENGDLDALLLDRPQAITQASEHCDMYAVDETIFDYDFVALYPQDIDIENVVKPLDSAIVRSFEYGQQKAFQEIWFKSPKDTKCLNNDPDLNDQIEDYVGVFLVLTALFGCAFWVKFFQVLHICFKKKYKKEKDDNEPDEGEEMKELDDPEDILKSIKAQSELINKLIEKLQLVSPEDVFAEVNTSKNNYKEVNQDDEDAPSKPISASETIEEGLINKPRVTSPKNKN